MGLGRALKSAGGKLKKAVTAPVKATKQLAGGNVKGSLKTAAGGIGATVAPLHNQAMAPLRAGKQIAKGNFRGAARTGLDGAVGMTPAAPANVAPAGQGGIAQDIFSGVGPAAGAIARGGFTGGIAKPAMAAPAPAMQAMAPAVGNMAGMLAGQFAPQRKPIQGGMGGFDMGGGY